MSAALFVFAPGFWDNEAVHIALAIGAAVAIVTGVVGVFTVMRGQSFAGEALGDIVTTGGSAAALVGAGPLAGFVAVDILAAAAMELVGVQRVRGRDLATGVVLGAAIGLAALFLYLDTTHDSGNGSTVTILFGSIFAISSATIPAVVVLALAAATIALLYRPPLLATVSPEMAAARGIPVRAVGALYLLAPALATALAAITIGTILSTALLIGPAASALRLGGLRHRRRRRRRGRLLHRHERLRLRRPRDPRRLLRRALPGRAWSASAPSSGSASSPSSARSGSACSAAAAATTRSPR